MKNDFPNLFDAILEKAKKPHFFLKNCFARFNKRNRRRTFAADLNQAFDVNMTVIRKYWIALIFSGLSIVAFAQNEHPQPAGGQQPEGQSTEQAETAEPGEHPGGQYGALCGGHSINEDEPFNAGENAVHHISDANVIHIYGDLYLNLPALSEVPRLWLDDHFFCCVSPAPPRVTVASTEGYVLVKAALCVCWIQPSQMVIMKYPIMPYGEGLTADGKQVEIFSAIIEGECKELEFKTSYDGGLMGGGITGFYDFSLTRNVFTMLLTVLILFFVFRRVANSATRTHGHAPKGLQNFIEPFYTFIRDERAETEYRSEIRTDAVPVVGIFLIWVLTSSVRFRSSRETANVTGNISVTIVLAVITFLISTLSANKHFWQHTLRMPGVPPVLKVLILTPIEILGLFLKPFTLLLRLFANITAGHIVILSFVSLIFIFGHATTQTGRHRGWIDRGYRDIYSIDPVHDGARIAGSIPAGIIFTMLSATYIGTAIEEPHHDHH